MKFIQSIIRLSKQTKNNDMFLRVVDLVDPEYFGEADEYDRNLTVEEFNYLGHMTSANNCNAVNLSNDVFRKTVNIKLKRPLSLKQN
jgi:hypothetical protein